MNVSGYSTNGLMAMHGAIRNCLQIDDALPKGGEKFYGVRDYQDWRQQADLIEAELDNRKITYQKIVW
jgi:hypothetical protein